MRKSRAVSTLLLAGSALALSACDSQEEARMYSDVEACVADGGEEAKCREAFEQARTEHAANAPRFRTREECEAELGQGACTPAESQVSGGGGWFMPFMMGYMVSNAFSRMGGGYGYSRPLYADRNGYVYAGRDRVSRFGGNCNPMASNCGGRTAGTAAGRPPPFAGRTTVPRDTFSTAASSRPGGSAVSSQGSRSYGGFGRTGSRAGGFSGG
jgi:uncharacterized protein YgiB involved in biofilm formation